MKSSLLALIAVLAVYSIPSAPASTTQPIYYSQLSNVRLQGGSNSTLGYRGSVVVNEVSRTVTLDIEGGPFCPANAMCIMGSTQLLNVTLPITDVVRNPNGERIITAEQDLRTVDGALQKLVLIDYSGAHVPGAPAVIAGRYLSQGLDRSAGRVVTRRAEFNGTPLLQHFMMSHF